MFQRLEDGPREAGSVTPTVHVNGSRPRTARTPANERATTAAVEREPLRTHAIPHENWGLSQTSVLQLLHDD
jgi:hypothetical protein